MLLFVRYCIEMIWKGVYRDRIVLQSWGIGRADDTLYQVRRILRSKLTARRRSASHAPGFGAASEYSTQILRRI
jgi:hypothetical protein